MNVQEIFQTIYQDRYSRKDVVNSLRDAILWDERDRFILFAAIHAANHLIDEFSDAYDNFTVGMVHLYEILRFVPSLPEEERITNLSVKEHQQIINLTWDLDHWRKNNEPVHDLVFDAIQEAVLMLFPEKSVENFLHDVYYAFVHPNIDE